MWMRTMSEPESLRTIYLVLRLDEADLDEWRSQIGETMNLEGNDAVLIDAQYPPSETSQP